MSFIENTNNGEAFDYTVGHGSNLANNDIIHGYC